jgi:hypothetical protein
MTQVIINENTVQGQAILSLVKTLPKKIASIVVDEDDLSDCISIDEFGKRLKAEVKKRYERKTPTKK